MGIRYPFILHCIKYARIRVFTDLYSLADSALIREKVVSENPYSRIFNAVLTLCFIEKNLT